MKKFSLKQRLILTLLLAFCVMPTAVNTGIKTGLTFCIGAVLVYKHSDTLGNDFRETKEKFGNAKTSNEKFDVVKNTLFATANCIENDALEFIQNLTNWRVTQKQNADLEKNLEVRKQELLKEQTERNPNTFVKEELLKPSGEPKSETPKQD